MAKFRVYVLDPYHEDATAFLQKNPEVELTLPSDPDAKNWPNDAEGLMLRSDTRLTEKEFVSAKKLKVVVKQGVGVDNIDLESAKKHGISVHNTPAMNSEAVAELALALPLTLARRISEFDRKLRNGEKIVRSEMLGLSLYEKTVGVVGMGHIGKEVAKKWSRACESKIVSYDPVAPKDAWSDIKHKRVDNLDDLVKESDVITLHVPLINSTRGMIGEKEFGLMKSTAILVNCARGGVVDEAALVKALEENKIWGAVLDAVENEPPTLENNKHLLSKDNVIITPHVGASTIENQSRSGVVCAEILLGVLQGKTDAIGKLV